GVSFAVAAGEIFGLLGPNGGGKTTLFRLLSTLLPLTAGRVSVMGIDVQRDPAYVRRCLGVTFQSPSLDGRLTVRENLTHQGHLYGLRGRDLRSRIDAVVGWLGLSDRLAQTPDTLSGGLKRRVEIAKSLLHAPRVLILDEPSTGLDPGARLDLWQVLARVRREEQITVLVTTHLMDEAERCDRLGILDRGRLVAVGTPDELRQSIGDNALTITSSDPESLANAIRQQFSIESQRLGDQLRIESARGLELLRELVVAYPDQIEAISLSKPTLEDVFIDRTGHRFWDAG
ncbi:MAG: ABC transporter ATP-binding protein, partial [Planctomycetales bacterium 12-60-4]